jgi:AmmeMemoRadiSam system protein B/AmmeMemoRadiSam system protein A
MDSFYSKADVQKVGEVKALIAPHAGYAYSGQVAAYSFKQVENGNYSTVIILAPSHQYPLEGAAVSNHTHYRTPLGDVKVSSLTQKLLKASSLIKDLPEAQSSEHAAEIEVPFIQKSLPGSEIAPIIVGKISLSQIDELADLLIKHIDERTLIVASTDLSHYHPYDEAVALDAPCVEAIVAGNFRNASRCEMCGYYPVLVLMKVAQKLNWSPKLLKYMNSGDVTGDKSAVVGYASIVFYKASEKKVGLSAEQKRYLLKVARDTIELYAKEKKRFEPQTTDPALKENKGVFVTLEKDGDLRGCIGHLEAVQPLFLDVRDNAWNAAFRDPRFKPVSAGELSDIEVEVSVLSAPELIDAGSPEEYLKSIQPNVDGIILDYKGAGATYLPQVWEMLPDKEQFLSSLCQKANLSADCWKKQGVKLYRYHVDAFKEGELL